MGLFPVTARGRRLWPGDRENPDVRLRDTGGQEVCHLRAQVGTGPLLPLSRLVVGRPFWPRSPCLHAGDGELWPVPVRAQSLETCGRCWKWPGWVCRAPCPVLAPWPPRGAGGPVGGPGGGRLWGLRRVGGPQGGLCRECRGFACSLHGDIVALSGWLYPQLHILLHNPPKPQGPQRPHTSFTPPLRPSPGPPPCIPVCSGGLGAQTRTWAPGQPPW